MQHLKNNIHKSKYVREVISVSQNSRRSKLKVYSSTKRQMTEKERQHLNCVLQKERKKYEQDLKCGGVSDRGYYLALHYRWDEV